MTQEQRDSVILARAYIELANFDFQLYVTYLTAGASKEAHEFHVSAMKYRNLALKLLEQVF